METDTITKILCNKCSCFVITTNKVTCKEGYFKNIPINKAKLFNPMLFECIDYE